MEGPSPDLLEKSETWQGDAPPFLGERDWVSGPGRLSPAPGWLQQPPCIEPHGAGPCRPSPCPCGLTVIFSESQKAEDLCPCLKWVDAHQRWGVFDSRVRAGMCQHCSGRHQASPPEDLCCKSMGQVRPRSSKGQSRPCISIQGLGSQSVEKSLRVYLLQGGRSGKPHA